MLEDLEHLDEPAQRGDQKGYKVNWFEEDEEGNRRQMANEDDTDGGLSDFEKSQQVGEMEEIVKELGHHFKTPEERRAFADAMRETNIDWGLVEADPREADKAEQKLDDYQASIDREIEAISADLPPELRQEIEAEMGSLIRELEGQDHDDIVERAYSAYPQVPEKPWTANQRRKITRLNQVIRKTTQDMRRNGKITNKGVMNLYKAYHAARLPLANSWDTVPLDVWDFLWHVLAADKAINPNRYNQVTLLSRDMGEAQVEFTPAQQLLTIEALHADGWETKALESWKRCTTTLGDVSAETFRQFWELGIQMHCQSGDVEQAEQSMEKLLSNGVDPRVVKPLIRAYCEKEASGSQGKAWMLYRSMRDNLGSSMLITDYDEVISYFLATHQTESALYAFVDMMSEGEVDMTKQQRLPSFVANKFFVGKWLKRLIGAGDLDGAYSVVEFMRMKGVEAAPIQLNGLIGAWHRKGGAEDHEKAAALAWAMIEARIDYVKAKEKKVESTGIISWRRPQGPAPFPRATRETFSVLAENYRVRGLHKQLLELWDKFKEAQMNADAFMINQLLESYIQGGQHQKATELYTSLMQDKGISPDAYTFSALWKTLGVNRLHLEGVEDMQRETVAARVLFSEMIKAQVVFEGRMDGQLARKVLHTFRRLGDHAAIILALRAMKDCFGFLPPETLALEMALNTTRLSWDSPTQRKLLMVAKKEIDQEMLAWAEGNDPEKLDGANRAMAMYEYLQQKYWVVMGDEADRPAMITEAAQDMGLYELFGLDKQEETV